MKKKALKTLFQETKHHHQKKHEETLSMRTVYLATLDTTTITANTANMVAPSNPPSDISHISETQMPPIDTSRIKTEPRQKLNMSCDIIVIDSDSNDSIVNLIPETPSSTEKPIPPPNGQSVPETPTSDDDSGN